MNNPRFFIAAILACVAVSLPEAAAQFVTLQSKITRQDVLNSPKPETNIALTADRLTIYFTSLRGGNWWNQSTDGGDADIYYSIRFDTASPWSAPRTLPTPINDELGQDEVHISPDGRALTYQRWSYDWANEGGPYYEVDYRGNNEWEAPRSLGGAITEFFANTNNRATDGMTRLRDGSIIFAAGPEYNKPMDLFYARYLGKNQWEDVAPLTCNTAHDERSVFLAADGKTLYFASDRPGGRGGLDVYRMELKADGTPGKIENIGPPVNTERDEYGFVIHNEQEAYFIREGDIYRIENPPLKLTPEKPLRAAEDPGVVVPVAPPVVTAEPKPEPDPPVVDTTPGEAAPSAERDASGPVKFEKVNNVVFLLDISASMDTPDKLPLMLGSIQRMVPFLREADQVSLITFADEPLPVLNGVSGDQHRFILGALEGHKARGKTNGKEALQSAFRYADTHFVENGNNIVIMATDGRMETGKLKSLAAVAAKRGIRLVVFLYGTPPPHIAKAFDEITRTTNGWQRGITADNIDTSLQDALLATLRRQ